MAYRAAIYARISQDREAKKSGSVSAAIERQIEDCTWFCQEKGYKLVATYQDVSISAYSDKERPSYDQMLRDFKAGKFDIIVAWKLDRLTRNTFSFVDMVRELEEYGLRVYTDDLGEQDLTDFDGVQKAIIAATQAQHESYRKSQRMKRANKQRAERGMIKRGTRCFGYDRNFHVVESEAEVVRAIYAAYNSGTSMSAITRALSGQTNELPEIPRTEAPSVIFARERGEDVESRPFGLAAVQSILHNPRYAGYVYYNPVTDGKCHSLNSDWSQYIVRDRDGEPVKAVWPAIIEPEAYWTAQRLRERNKLRADGTPIDRNGAQRKHFGAGIYRCGICGKPMHSSDAGYRCDGHVNRMREKVDDFVIRHIRERLSRPDVREIFVTDNTGQVKKIDERIRAAKGEMERARHDYKARLIDGELYHEIVNEQNGVIAELEAERATLVPRNASTSILEAKDPVAAFDALTDPGQIAAVIRCLCDVTLLPRRNRIKYSSDPAKRDAELAKTVIIRFKGSDPEEA